MIKENDHVLKNPPHLGLIIISLIIAFIATLLPYRGMTLYLEPQWVLIVLIHWWLRDPWRVGQSAAFFMGLLMDIAMTGTLGVSAFSFSVAAWVLLRFRTRLLGFSPLAQGVQLIPIFFGVRALTALSASLAGQDHVSWVYLVGTVVDLALWTPITLFLHFQDLKRSYRTP